MDEHTIKQSLFDFNGCFRTVNTNDNGDDDDDDSLLGCSAV
jgi:hypothetical protein